MPVVYRKRIKQAQDRAEIARLYLQGKTQMEIAALVGLSQAQVSRDLKTIQEQWLASSIFDLDAAKARELARVDEVEREYWAAWSASKGEQSSSTVETGADPLKPRARIVKRQAHGNPAFLAGVVTCIELRCKLLGLNAPEKSQSINIDLSKLDDEQLERIAAGEDPYAVALAGRRGAGAAPAASDTMPAEP